MISDESTSVPASPTEAPFAPAPASDIAKTALLSIDYPAVDATSLSTLVELRTMAAIETSGGWSAIADGADGRPVLLSSVDGLEYEVIGDVSGLPERTEGPYRLWLVGDDLVLYAQVADAQNSSLKSNIAARSTDGMAWSDLGLMGLVDDFGGAAVAGDGQSIGMIGEPVVTVPDDPASPRVTYLIRAETGDVEVIDFGYNLRGITADGEHVYAVVTSGGGSAPFLSRLQGDEGTIMLLSRRYGPLATNNIGDTMLAFNEDRLFVSDDRATSWTEYVYPGSVKSFARFGMFGAIDDQISPLAAPSVALSLDGVIWHDVGAPTNAVDAHTLATNRDGAIVVFRLEGLQDYVVAQIPWPVSGTPAAELANVAKQASSGAVVQMAADLLSEVSDVDSILPCIEDQVILDVPDEIFRAALACDGQVLANLRDAVSASVQRNADLFNEEDQVCLINAIDDLSAARTILLAGNALDSEQLGLVANGSVHLACQTTIRLDSSDVGLLLRQIVDLGGRRTLVPPALFDNTNHWWITGAEFQLIVRSDLATGDLISARLLVERRGNTSNPLSSDEQAMFRLLGSSFGYDITDEGIANPGLLFWENFEDGLPKICFDESARLSTIRFIPSPEVC